MFLSLFERFFLHLWRESPSIGRYEQARPPINLANVQRFFSASGSMQDVQP